MSIRQQKQEIIDNLDFVPENKLYEIDIFVRYIMNEAKQKNLNKNEIANERKEEYVNIDLLSIKQNEELKRRLYNLENNKTNFTSFEEFKKKYSRYVQD
ncbi:MAG: hypothetical protein HN704_11490 [Bacteroidetes bacterium]|jgi:hypothetical protein|nr:hypothetical protein [Bacteroidota bacterium]MBT6685695.1 hypothetical protein [Bacteroidota bacterium]MBT7143490.1 hypothetical protein [Bacteroidota bacterium]MBT7492215.1 hypothetical protein [Bacteroidota bacterium]